MIRFLSSSHKYESIVPDGRIWTSVTTCLKSFYLEFNDSIADRNAVDPNSKWYGIPPDEIRQIWKNESRRSTDLGTWYHNKRESEEINAIQCCPLKEEWKYAGNQVLYDGIYPEIMLYHPEYNVCGQSDRVEVKDGIVNINDYKTNKTISTSGFRGKKMLGPVKHLDDCELSKYNLQLSIYMFMVLYHNSNLLPGKLEIEHVTFEVESLDQYGYPITKRDKNGDPIIKDVKIIQLPYLKKEAQECLQYVKEKQLKKL